VEVGLIFALGWAVLALVGGALLVVRRQWLADAITAERQSRAGLVGSRGPRPTVFLAVGLVFVAMGLFILGWWASTAL
jgi:hypothetical protein